jgi:TetR/AcrR family transcriptional regulator, cholesterol catabolism regulator
MSDRAPQRTALLGVRDRRAHRDGNSMSNRILVAATALFYERGYHATTMREIASAVGIKAGSLYNHFGAKEDILFEICHGVMVEMLRDGQRAIRTATSREARLRRLVEFHVRFCAEDRFRSKVADDQLHALSDARRRQVLDIRDTYEQLFRDILAEGREDEGWEVDDVAVVTFALATMANSVNVWFRDDGRMTAAAVASIYGDLAVRAVRAGRTRSSYRGGNNRRAR